MFFLTMKKFIKRQIRRIILLILIAGSIVWFLGYKDYKKVIQEKPLRGMIAEFKKNRDYVFYEQLPVILLDATVAVEDERFWERMSTLDVQALGRAVFYNIKNMSLQQGGSTIPQQVAKNLYYDHNASVIRKVSEYYITKDILNELSKGEILELYVNIIYYGNGAYGIESAANRYFGLSVWELNEGELTLLSGLPQAPSVYDLTQNYTLAKARQEHVLYRMVENKKITEKESEVIFNMEVLGYEEND